MNGTGTAILPGVTLAGVLPELGILLLFGLITIPLGLFGRAEG